MRLLHIDTDPLARETLSQVVNRRTFHRFSVQVVSVGSEAEALKAITGGSFDFVVVDPEISEVDIEPFLDDLRNRGRDFGLVIASRLQRWSVALTAIRYRAEGYWTKPLAPGTVESSLDELFERRQKNSDQDRRASDSRRLAAQNRHLAAQGLIQALSLPGSTSESWKLWLSSEGAPGPLVRLCRVRFSAPPGAGSSSEGIRSLYVRYVQDLVGVTSLTAGPFVDQQALVLQGAGDDRAADQEILDWEAYQNKKWGPELDSGLIDWKRGPLVPRGRLAAARDEILRNPQPPFDAPSSLGNQAGDQAFMDHLLAGNLVAAGKTLETLLQNGDGGAESPTFRFRIQALLINTCRVMVKRQRLTVQQAETWADLRHLQSIEGKAEFCIASLDYFRRLCQQLADLGAYSSTVGRCLARIQRDYAEPLTLDQVAQSLSVTPARLSKTLVQELGKGFSATLIDHRLGKAQELLALPGSAIKDVAARCGYPDANYFSRLFHRYVGITPRDFAAGIRLDSRNPKPGTETLSSGFGPT